MWDYVDKINKNLETLINNINTFNDYFWHPSHLFKQLWKNFVNSSFDICLFVALLGFTLYCIGYKKGSKLTIGSMAAYFLIKYISKAI